MAFIYNEVGWEDLPSTTTPRNSTTLGNMDTGIKENNKMLNGASSMGNVIVESIESKNLFNYESIFPATTGVLGTDIEYGLNVSIQGVGEGTVTFNVSSDWQGVACDYIEVEPLTAYTVSYQSSKGQTQQYIKVVCYADSKQMLNDFADNNITSLTITTPANTKYIRIILENISNTQDTITFYNIMCEKGSNASEYVPYKYVPLFNLIDKVQPYYNLDLNNFLTPGLTNFYATTLNKPNIPGFADYGTVICLHTYDWYTQIAIGNYNGTTTIATRTNVQRGNPNSWNEWRGNNGVDTGWVDISQYLNTTYFAIRSRYTPMIRKIGNVVYLKGVVYCHTSPNNTFATLFTNLPGEFIANYESLGGGVHWELGTPYAINMGSGEITVTESSNISPTYDYQGYALTNIPTYIV